MREYQVRICERLGVQFPGPTRQTANCLTTEPWSAVGRTADPQPSRASFPSELCLLIPLITAAVSPAKQFHARLRRERWARHVLRGGGIDRRYYELCVLSELRDRLRAGDIWVVGSRRYRALEERLISREKADRRRRRAGSKCRVQGQGGCPFCRWAMPKRPILRKAAATFSPDRRSERQPA
jgi:hypothetical protein